MKKFVLLLAVSAFVLPMIAQKSAVPLVEEGRTWRMVILYPTDSPESDPEKEYYQDESGAWYVVSPYGYVLKGDTVVYGKTYKKLCFRDNHSICVCGLRQEGNRVYRCDLGGSREYLNFDFGLKVGDVFAIPEIDDISKMRVEWIDTISINGVKRRRLAMREYREDAESTEGILDIWIEGIGNMNGPDYSFWWTAITLRSHMLDCSQDGKLLASYEDFTHYSTSEISTIPQYSGKNANPHIYDLQGRRLTTEPKHGVYIKGGKLRVKSGM